MEDDHDPAGGGDRAIRAQVDLILTRHPLCVGPDVAGGVHRAEGQQEVVTGGGQVEGGREAGGGDRDVGQGLEWKYEYKQSLYT